MKVRRFPRSELHSLGIEAEVVARFVATTGPLAVVDLETTGLPNDPTAELLEFGAVCIEPGISELVTVQTLLRPSRPLSRVIQRLTGLTDSDLADAPELREVASALADALRGRVLVAHNIDFERYFLARDVERKLEDATYLDSQDILSLTHPDSADLRLESFIRRLLGEEERHRALDDALDTLRVLSRLGEGADAQEARYAVARDALEAYAPESPWLPLLGKRHFAEADDSRVQFVEIGEASEPAVPFDEAEIAAVLADEVRGRRHVPGYRARKEQIELTRHFVRTLRDGGISLLEGGTGVGKSFAYLAAAIPYAMQNRISTNSDRPPGGNGAPAARRPIVISTRTKLLQDQLLEKDIAAAARFLGYGELKALSIKGRANYACARRFAQVLAEGREPTIFPEDRMAYAALEASVRTRPFGEIGSLPPALLRRFPPLRGLLRRAVAGRSEQCSREECARNPNCPLGRRRAALAEADLVIANHDLLLRWPTDYPSFEHAIVDEVHELAEVADEVYAIEVRPEEILDRIDEAFGRPGQRRGALLPNPERRTLEADARAWRRQVQQELVAVGRALQPLAGDWGEVQIPEPPDARFDEAAGFAGQAARELASVAEAIDAANEEAANGQRSAALARIAEELRGSARALDGALTGSGADAVAAFEGVRPPFDRWRLVVRPVSPASAFHERFLSMLESFSGVSASVFIAGDAFAALGALELEQRAGDCLERVSVPSPFPYAEHMRVVAMKGGTDLVEETAVVLETLALQLRGRTLGLFTSLRRMHQVAEILSERLRGEGIEVLTPRGVSDDPAALVARFRRGGNAVLLGARAFWQGLDIPGMDLQALVIEKLPFEVPSELRKRRELRMREEGIDPFRRQALGRMLLYLKQMIGRLIRSEQDRGVVVIVEGRPDRPYFRRLSEALPPESEVRVVGLGDLPAVLAEVGIGEGAGRTGAP